MTSPPKEPLNAPFKRAQSTLPFSEIELLAVRMLPAEFSRAVGVSKQTVSKWISKGKVTLGGDGRLNPNQAMRELMRNCEPGRLRARLFRQAFSDVTDLRSEAARAVQLDQEVADLEAELESVQRAYELATVALRSTQFAIEKFACAVIDRESEFRATEDFDGWANLVDVVLVEVMASAEDEKSAVAPLEGGEGTTHQSADPSHVEPSTGATQCQDLTTFRKTNHET